jgi:hypothetical protein
MKEAHAQISSLGVGGGGRNFQYGSFSVCIIFFNIRLTIAFTRPRAGKV